MTPVFNPPQEIKNLIASYISDPVNLISLGGVSRAWRNAASGACRKKVEALFGRAYLGNREPVTAASELWAPWKPKKRRLATVLEQNSENLTSYEINGGIAALESLLDKSSVPLKDKVFYYKQIDGVEVYGSDKLFYLLFEKWIASTVDESELRRAALLMRAWRYEVGMEAIQKDKRLATIAGQFFIRKDGLNISKLLMSYGVKVQFN